MKKKTLLSVFSIVIFGSACYAQNQFPANGPVQINNVNDNNRLLIQQTTEPTGQNLVSFITGVQRGIFFKDRPNMQGGLWLLGGGCCYPEGDTRMSSSAYIGAGVYGDGASFIPTANQASFMRFQEGKIDFYGLNNLTPGSVIYPTSSASKMSLTSFPNTQLNVNGELRGKELTINTTSDFKGFRLSYNDGFPQPGWGDVYFDNERWGGYFTWRLGSANGYLNIMRLDASSRILTLHGEVRGKGIIVNNINSGSGDGLRISYEDRSTSGGTGEAYFDNTLLYGGFSWRQLKVTPYSQSYQNLMRLDQSGTLRLDGEFRAKAIRVRADVWADYVFEANYKLPKLSDVEQYIKVNKHLPNIPSENEIVKNGLDVAQMQEKQMQKIEELTLYVIELEKQNKKLQEQMNRIESKLKI